WQRDLGPFTSQHGAGASPIVYDGKVYLANDQDGTSVLLALDARTGQTVWQAPRRAFRACYSTPLVLEQRGRPAELIVGSTAGLPSYAPSSGRQNWQWTWTHAKAPLRRVASPVAGAGLLFLSGGEGGGARHVVAVKAEGKGDVTRTNLAWE